MLPRPLPANGKGPQWPGHCVCFGGLEVHFLEFQGNQGDLVQFQSEVRIPDPVEALHEEPGTHEQKDRQRCLKGCESGPDPGSFSRAPSPAAGESACQGCPASLDAGEEPGEEAG